jgi:hypothetical protein
MKGGKLFLIFLAMGLAFVFLANNVTAECIDEEISEEYPNGKNPYVNDYAWEDIDNKIGDYCLTYSKGTWSDAKTSCKGISENCYVEDSYCEGSQVDSQRKECKFGCEDGVCLTVPSTCEYIHPICITDNIRGDCDYNTEIHDFYVAEQVCSGWCQETTYHVNMGGFDNDNDRIGFCVNYLDAEETLAYVEYANTVKCNGDFDNCERVYDGDWNNYGSRGSTASYFADYNKPEGANSAVWRVKYDQVVNELDVPQDCFDQEVLRLSVYWPRNTFQLMCHDGVEWTILGETKTNVFREEAVIFDFGEPQIPPPPLECEKIFGPSDFYQSSPYAYNQYGEGTFDIVDLDDLHVPVTAKVYQVKYDYKYHYSSPTNTKQTIDTYYGGHLVDSNAYINNPIKQLKSHTFEFPVSNGAFEIKYNNEYGRVQIDNVEIYACSAESVPEGQEYQRGDAFYNPCGTEWSTEDCSEESPDWTWSFDGLMSNSPELQIKNSYLVNGAENDPVGEGECYDYPCSEYKLCFDRLVAGYGRPLPELGHAAYTIEYADDNDFSNINAPWTSEAGIYMHTDEPYGWIRLESDNLEHIDRDTDTTKVYLHILPQTEERIGVIGVYYEDFETRNLLEAGYIDTTGELDAFNFARVFWRNTNQYNIEFDLSGSTLEENSLKLTLDVMDDEYIMEDSSDDVTISFGHDSEEFNSIGDTVGEADGDELLWGAEHVEIGQRDEDHRTVYGIIIENPKMNGDSDEVKLRIPFDQVRAEMTLRDKNDAIVGGERYGIQYVPLGDTTDFSQGFATQANGYTAWLETSEDRPIVHTSLTGKDDAYLSNVYVEVPVNSFLYTVTKEGPLVIGDDIEFLGQHITLINFDEIGVTFDGELDCEGELFGPGESVSTNWMYYLAAAVVVGGLGYWYFTKNKTPARRRRRR